MKLDFNNTDIAFGYKSDKELKRAYRLFKAINVPFLANNGPGLTIFALKIGFPIKSLLKNYLFDQFIGGTSIASLEKRIKQLAEHNVKVILDYAVEFQSNEESFEACANEIINTLEIAANNETVEFSVLKVSGIASPPLLEKVQKKEKLSEAETTAFQRVKNRLDRICEYAADVKAKLFIDAEESWVQNVIDELTEEMMAKYNKENPWIQTTLQMYRHDRLEYLKALHQRSLEQNYKLGLKLVRGAYHEKENDTAKEKNYPTPIYPNKRATDEGFNQAVTYCLENIAEINLCVASHNQESAIHAANLMEKLGLAKDDKRVWFSQLLGMSDNISFNLAANEYNVTKYLPYGPLKEVLPYLFRRASENSSVAGQSSRELELIKKEMLRRKKVK